MEHKPIIIPCPTCVRIKAAITLHSPATDMATGQQLAQLTGIPIDTFMRHAEMAEQAGAIRIIRG